MSTSSSQLLFFKSLFEYSSAVMSQSAILELTSTMSLSLSKFDFSASALIVRFASGRAQNRVLCEDLHMRQWDDGVALPILAARKIVSTRHQLLAALPGTPPA